MKNTLLSLGFFALLMPAFLHASSEDDLKGVYRPATVESVQKVNVGANYAYDIGVRVECILYVARYKSASDYVPVEIAPHHLLNVRVNENDHWLSIFLTPRPVELRLMSATNSTDKACNAGAATTSSPIPVGTLLPVTLGATLRSGKSQSGEAIAATLMQDVALGDGVMLHKGARIRGHVTESIRPGKGSDEPRISFQFDQVQAKDRTVPVTVNLRAIASATAVTATQVPKSSADGDAPYNWNLSQIGGDETAYGQEGPVVLGDEVVGKNTGQGVLAYVSQDLGTECRSTMAGNTRPQAFWVFSVHACGAYGFGDVKILHSGRTEPVGEIVLTSTGKTVKVGRGSAMLLRVDRSGPESETTATASGMVLP
jgi:hypothetical protein